MTHISSNGIGSRSEPISILTKYGRSFRLAGRLLPKATLHGSARLYAFCRAIDDLADETTDAEWARSELSKIARAIETQDRSTPLAAEFHGLVQQYGVSRSAGLELIATVSRDLDCAQIADDRALLAYAYGAAGTVGVMMCAVLGANDPRARAPASDLGIAMQLTNIARDVMEDAVRGRVYLPGTWLPHGLSSAGFDKAPESVFGAVQRVLALADERYRSAEAGMVYLPRRVRPAIRSASRLYQEIGIQILRQGPGYLQSGRCVVPHSRRLWVMLGCLIPPMRGRKQTLHRDPGPHTVPGAPA